MKILERRILAERIRECKDTYILEVLDSMFDFDHIKVNDPLYWSVWKRTALELTKFVNVISEHTEYHCIFNDLRYLGPAWRLQTGLERGLYNQSNKAFCIYVQLRKEIPEWIWSGTSFTFSHCKSWDPRIRITFTSNL